MGRARGADVQLPEGVQIVKKSNGARYYYWAPKRSTKNAGQRVPLGNDPQDPVFWATLRKARGLINVVGTFSSLIDAFQKSKDWEQLRPATQKDYRSYLNRLDTESGDRLVKNVTRADIYKMHDAMKDTPVAANHMLAVLQTLIEWGVPRDYRKDNPVVGMKRFKIEGDGARPWTDEAFRLVLDKAPPDIRRMAFLGRCTGQRAGDIVRMKPAHLSADGITVNIGKRREKAHFVPLTKEEVAEIRSWNVGEMDWFVKSTRGKKYTATHLNSRWNRWRDSDDAKPIAGLTLTIHGLRATKVSDLNLSGATGRQISDEIGMSVQMVERYLRFQDRAHAARKSRDERVFKLSNSSRPVPAMSGET